jgi:hypothetical protein
MESSYSDRMTGHEVSTVSPTGYTNEGVCMTWLDNFLDRTGSEPDKSWRILLMDDATCHEAPESMITAKMSHI